MYKKSKVWNDSEVEILCQYYSTHKAVELADMLPGRTVMSIYRKAQTLMLSSVDLERRSEEGKLCRTLKNLGMSMKKICEVTGYSRRTVTRRLSN